MLTIAVRPWVRVPLVTLLALAVQLSLFTDMRPFDAVADVMLLLVLASGMVAGPRDGALGQHHQVAAAVGVRVSSAPWWIGMLIMGAASAVGVFVYAAIGTVFGLRDAVNVHLVTVMLVVGVVNLLLAVPALWVQRWALLGSDRA